MSSREQFIKQNENTQLSGSKHDHDGHTGTHSLLFLFAFHSIKYLSLPTTSCTTASITS